MQIHETSEVTYIICTSPCYYWRAAGFLSVMPAGDACTPVQYMQQEEQGVSLCTHWYAWVAVGALWWQAIQRVPALSVT